MLPSQRAFLQLENSHGGEVSTQPLVPLPLSMGKDWHQKGSGLQRWAVFAPCDPQTATSPSLLYSFMGFTWKRDAASPSHPSRHKRVVLTCREKSEGTRGTERGVVTFDTGEKRAELSGAAEVREADVTPEKSTIVKGTGRAGQAKARGPEGYPLPTEGWLWLYTPRAWCRDVPSSVKPICCLSDAWRVKPRVPLVYRDTKLL